MGVVSNEIDIAELEARVAKMRALGVTRWGDIELGPEPVPADTAKTQTQHVSPEAIERKQRETQRAIALGASGRLVPRLERLDKQ